MPARVLGDALSAVYRPRSRSRGHLASYYSLYRAPARVQGREKESQWCAEGEKTPDGHAVVGYCGHYRLLMHGNGASRIGDDCGERQGIFVQQRRGLSIIYCG